MPNISTINDEELHDLLVSGLSSNGIRHVFLTISRREEAINAFVTVAEEAALRKPKRY